MARINSKITIRSVYFGMLLLSAAVMISAVRLTVASDLDSLKAAAEQGDATAQVNLGAMYSTGEGVPEDYVQAYAWSNIAAAQGHETAKEFFEIISKIIPPADITKAQELSREYWEAYGPNRTSSE